MDQARYWRWASSKSSSASESSYFVPSASSSWEEEAFAEDATGPFGAFIWPPRSYSCSFCGREFKSAQALGGHMNVHRRDRARLKQGGSDYIINPSRSIPFELPNQTCTLVYNIDDTSANSKELLATSLLPVKVSTSITQGKNINSNDLESMVLSALQDHRKEPLYSCHNPSSSYSPSIRTLSSLDYPKIEEDLAKEQNSRPHEGDAVKRDLPTISLNLAIGCGKNKMSCSKRRRIDGVSSPFFLKETTEDLDLELRLGDHPKVKFN